MSNADRLLEGAMDIHVHCAPDPKVERRGSAIDMAQQARDMGMLGMVFKSHEFPMHSPTISSISQPNMLAAAGFANKVFPSRSSPKIPFPAD